MPKLFEYLGIIFFFYSNEHEPIHVHARKGEFESKIEFILDDGVIVEIIIKNVKGKHPLKGADLKNLKDFILDFSYDIVSKWIDYFIYHKEIEFKRISEKSK